ncbi:hypothetical protein HanIR_Chr13g0621101 [Helianthus annuus]|nr:hypothetical protein HanIR_Chr13g0621101 [Helianthus annuus]
MVVSEYEDELGKTRRRWCVEDLTGRCTPRSYRVSFRYAFHQYHQLVGVLCEYSLIFYLIYLPICDL